MIRHVIHVALLFIGFTPVVWAACVFTVDPARAAVLVALGGIGLLINGIVLSGVKLRVSVPLRIVGVGVAVTVLATVLGMWHWIYVELLPMAPQTDNLEEASLLFQARNLIWIAGSVAYVLLTFMLLPSAPLKERPDPNAPQRIDFRTYGR